MGCQKPSQTARRYVQSTRQLMPDQLIRHLRLKSDLKSVLKIERNCPAIKSKSLQTLQATSILLQVKHRYNPADDVTMPLPALFRAEHVSAVAAVYQATCELWEVFITRASYVVGLFDCKVS